MSILSRIRKLSPRRKIAVGVVGGLIVGICLLLVLNSMLWGLPVNPQAYQYDYPNGTSATTPLTETSIDVHGSGVALSNNAYEVTYQQKTTLTDQSDGESEVVDTAQIHYQINNAEAVGYLERSNINMGVIDTADAPTLQIYENRTTAYIHNLEANNTTVQETGNEPLVLTNQIELPQRLVTAVPHVSWKPVDQRTENGSTYIIYKPTGANANQMSHMDTVTDVSGTLRVNTETSVITYSVVVEGTGVDETGETVDVKTEQSLTYTVLDNSTVPERPSWANGEPPSDGDESDGNTTESGNESDDGWTPPGKLSNAPTL